MDMAVERAMKYIKRISGKMKVGMLMFSLKHGVLGISSEAEEMIERNEAGL